MPAAGNTADGLATKVASTFGPAVTGNVAAGQTLSGNAGLTILNTGGSQTHNNMQPWEAVNYIIAMFGIYPSRS